MGRPALERKICSPREGTPASSCPTPTPAPSFQPQGACSASKGAGGSVASGPNSLWVMNACLPGVTEAGREAGSGPFI